MGGKESTRDLIESDSISTIRSFIDLMVPFISSIRFITSFTGASCGDVSSSMAIRISYPFRAESVFSLISMMIASGPYSVLILLMPYLTLSKNSRLTFISSYYTRRLDLNLLRNLVVGYDRDTLYISFKESSQL